MVFYVSVMFSDYFGKGGPEVHLHVLRNVIHQSQCKANAKALLLASDIMSSVSERKTTTSKIFWLCHFCSTEGS